MKIVYSDQYDLNLGNHVFPSSKYRLIKEKLLQENVIKPEDIVEPAPATDDDVALVHDRNYIWKLKNAKLSHVEILRMEVPYSDELVQAVWLSAGGSILAGRLALEAGIGINIAAWSLALAVAGIVQAYFQRVLGMDYLTTQGFMKLWYAVFWTSAWGFAAGVAMFLIDFFRLAKARA